MREPRSSCPMARARWIASAVPSMSKGFTDRASRIVSEAPASCDRIRTPGSPTWQATHSLATRFMPSRRGVTRATSASR